ncbi:metallophosphoesterase family protein [Salininema proteolyticum]|uniref:Metallophosphoesterase family protein n=1 Tax=Salininema proteolyticum TaxID=1607685 RepID=A0ABV8TVR9_9ACTN
MGFERVAVLSDVHGVLPALRAVLREPEVRAADHVVFCGDNLAGPLPVETLELMRSLGDRATFISGNADREMVGWSRDGVDPGHDESRWAAEQLSGDEVDFLAALPPQALVGIDGLGDVLFCHATPRNDHEVRLVDSPPGKWAEAFEGVEARTVVCGHTHMPFFRLVDRRRVVNPGSVGMPYGSGPTWCLLGPGVEFRETLLDAEAAAAEIAERSAFPGADEFGSGYLVAPPSDVEALEVFTPMVD